jgi:proteasome accessory factor B
MARMQQLHQQIKEGKFPNCRKLAEMLEISTKTVQRDIDFMRDRLNLPIEYDPLRFGFFYSRPVAHFPNIEVTEGEIIALFVAQKVLDQYKGTPFEKPLHAAFHKICDGLRESITFPWGDLDASFSFRNLGSTEADITLFESLSKAVLRSLETGFQYKKLGSSRYEERRVQPYHLACIEGQWYLFAFDLARNQLRTFVLQRMRDVKITAVKFKRPADFEISKHLGSSFGVFTGTGHYRIRLQFDAFAARLVSERRWHASQKIKPLGKDGSDGVEMTLELADLGEITRWILSWGGHARVLAPEELKQSVRAAAEKLLKG